MVALAVPNSMKSPEFMGEVGRVGMGKPILSYHLLNRGVQESSSPGLNPSGLRPRQLLIMGGSLLE